MQSRNAEDRRWSAWARALIATGGITTLAGVLAGAAGLVLFGSVFFGFFSRFSEAPVEALDTTMSSSFLGVLLFGAASFVVPIGGVLLAIGLALRFAGGANAPRPRVPSTPSLH